MILYPRFALRSGATGTGLIRFLAVALLLLVLCADTALAHRAITPEPRNTWLNRHNRMKSQAKQSQPPVVLIGDSITEFWVRHGTPVWREYFSPLNAANFGIGGDRTESILWRLENGAFDGISPKVIVVLIGTNNSQRDSVEQIVEGVTAVVQGIAQRQPQAKILLLGIFPRGQTPQDERHMKVMAVNPEIAKLADNEQVFYLDIGDKFLKPDGSVDPALMFDYLHLSEQGYRVWAEAMQPKLQELLAK